MKVISFSFGSKFKDCAGFSVIHHACMGSFAHSKMMNSLLISSNNSKSSQMIYSYLKISQLLQISNAVIKNFVSNKLARTKGATCSRDTYV